MQRQHNTLASARVAIYADRVADYADARGQDEPARVRTAPIWAPLSCTSNFFLQRPRDDRNNDLDSDDSSASAGDNDNYGGIPEEYFIRRYLNTYDRDAHNDIIHMHYIRDFTIEIGHPGILAAMVKFETWFKKHLPPTQLTDDFFRCCMKFRPRYRRLTRDMNEPTCYQVFERLFIYAEVCDSAEMKFYIREAESTAAKKLVAADIDMKPRPCHGSVTIAMAELINSPAPIPPVVAYVTGTYTKPALRYIEPDQDDSGASAGDGSDNSAIEWIE